jgi:signal transduction histidine kinase
LLGELFHALSQPLTALRCSLELALSARPDAPLRESLQAALGHAEQIAQITTGIRQLLEAGDPGDAASVLSVDALVRGAANDLRVLAESFQITFQFGGSFPGLVLAEPQRLQQALFYLLEYALVSAAPGSELHLEGGREQADSVVTLWCVRAPASLAGPHVTPINLKEERSRALGRRLGLAISGRIFETAGGALQVQESERDLRLRFRLPLAG